MELNLIVGLCGFFSLGWVSCHVFIALNSIRKITEEAAKQYPDGGGWTSKCPFCGGEGMIERVYRFSHHGIIRKVYSLFISPMTFGLLKPEVDSIAYFVQCRCCGAEGGWSKSRLGAIKKWAMRVEKIRGGDNGTQPGCHDGNYKKLTYDILRKLAFSY